MGALDSWHVASEQFRSDHLDQSLRRRCAAFAHIVLLLRELMVTGTGSSDSERCSLNQTSRKGPYSVKVAFSLEILEMIFDAGHTAWHCRPHGGCYHKDLTTAALIGKTGCLLQAE